MRRAALLLLALIAAATFAACGSSGETSTTTGGTSGGPVTTETTTTAKAAPLKRVTDILPAADPSERFRLPEDVDLAAVGTGAARVYVLRARKPPAEGPTVLFFHGFGSSNIQGYEPWLAHLVHRGSTVVFPSYQPPGSGMNVAFAKTAFNSATFGLAIVFARLEKPTKLVAAGISAGGALARDYAVSAKRLGLPEAEGVMAVYPGRARPGKPIALPAQPGSFDPSVRLIAIASPLDTIAGTKWARDMVRAATTLPKSHRRLVLVHNPAVGDHGAPIRTDATAQRTFWAPLDRLVASA
jgi:acetyl esterase/lipase